ncbi:hypothetical protein ACTMS0_03020 [Micromonospora sp. H33]|uniref:hypothetical protein n=1 Tax=Micromonospora sp. H33 TaxID=3452215 RepID=UPI003F888955
MATPLAEVIGPAGPGGGIMWVQGGSMAGYLIGGALLAVVPPRPLIVGLGLAGLLVVALFVPVVARAVRRDRAGGSAAPVPDAGGSTARRPLAAVLATPTPPAAPAPAAGDTVGAWSSTSRAPGSGTSSS